MTVPAPAPDWQLDAACLGDDQPNDWFIERDSDIDRALAVCAVCPVRVECLAHALANGEDVGIWGGKTQDDLRAIRRAARHRSTRH